jgi:hypothetical protein
VTADVSLDAGVPGTAVDGHNEKTPSPTVWNVQEVGAAMTLPAASVAPLTVAVYVVPDASALDGVKVAVLVAGL